MEDIRHIIIEEEGDEGVKGLFVMTEMRKFESENKIGIASLDRVYKRARMWDTNGDMYIRDYTEEEWNLESPNTAMDGYCKFDYVQIRRETVHLAFHVLLAYINYYLRDSSYDDFLTELDKGYLPFTFEELPPVGKELIKTLRDWDRTEPLGKIYGKVVAKCTKLKDEKDGNEYYDLDCFDIENKQHND